MINSKFLKNGIAYLLVLRLVPIFPFFLVNLAMGLTKIKIIIYYIVSQIGMLIGTFIYVNAGSEIAKINHLSDIASPSFILSMIVLGIIPLVGKKALRKFID